MTRVADLTGAELDLWVARAHGWVIGQAFSGECWKTSSDHAMEYTAEWKPSTDWSQGGQLIEKYRITIATHLPDASSAWRALLRRHMHVGPTPLIAAMRAFVASKFGENVTDQEAPCAQ